VSYPRSSGETWGQRHFRRMPNDDFSESLVNLDALFLHQKNNQEGSAVCEVDFQSGIRFSARDIGVKWVPTPRRGIEMFYHCMLQFEYET
jgi:hypothetical protein